MQVGHFPAAAANSLIDGYCSDFVSLAAVLAQTLEQVSMRGIDIRASHEQLARIESGMRGLAEAIRDLLDRGMVDSEDLSAMLGTGARPEPAAAPAGDAAPEPEPEKFVSDRTQALFINPTGPLDSAQPKRPASPDPAQRRPDPSTAAAGAPDYALRAEAQTRKKARHAATGAPAKAQEAPTTRAKPASNPPVEDDSGALRGTNDSMPVLSVIQFLGRTRKTGKLRIQLGDETISFEFDNGCVQACTSNKPRRGERLGDLLIETVGCDPNDLAALLKGQPATAKQLGELVVQAGLASNGQVLEALEQQVRRRFARACEAKNASYEFRDGNPGRSDGRVRIAPMELTFQPHRKPGE